MKEYIVNAVETLLEDLAGISTLNGSLIEENPSTQTSTDTAETSSELLNSALKSDFNSVDELKSKKLMAAALSIAKAKGLIEGPIGQAIAPLVDEGISRIKAEFQVGEGKIGAYEAADKIIDQATARVAVFLEETAPLYISKGVDALASAIACAYPQAATVIFVVKEPIKQALSKVAQKAVGKGLAKISSFAKSAVRKFGEKGKSYAGNFIKRYVLS